MSVFCINLDKRSDRRASAEKEFRKHKIPVKFHTVAADPRGGIYGCWESHATLMKKIWESKLDFGIIFEDDFRIIGNLPEIISEAEKLPKDSWDFISLHYDSIIYHPINKHFYRGTGWRTMGYLVNRNYLKRFVRQGKFTFPKPEGYHLDIELFINNKSPIYAEKQLWCYQPVIEAAEVAFQSNIGLFGLQKFLGYRLSDSVSRFLSRVLFRIYPKEEDFLLKLNFIIKVIHNRQNQKKYPISR